MAWRPLTVYHSIQPAIVVGSLPAFFEILSLSRTRTPAGSPLLEATLLRGIGGKRASWGDILQNPTQEVHRGRSADTTPPWIRAIGLAIGVGIAYFLAARLSLALLGEADGVALFWPAAGVSSGVLIALGRNARLPVVGGVMVATIIANLAGDRNVWSATIFAFCNAGEPCSLHG
jgi:hypothetical protein